MVSRWMTWWRNSVTGCGLLWRGGVPIHQILEMDWWRCKSLASHGFACCCPIAHSRCCRRRPWRNSSCPSLSPWCIPTMRQSWRAICWTVHAVCQSVWLVAGSKKHVLECLWSTWKFASSLLDLDTLDSLYLWIVCSEVQPGILYHYISFTVVCSCLIEVVIASLRVLAQIMEASSFGDFCLSSSSQNCAWFICMGMYGYPLTFHLTWLPKSLYLPSMAVWLVGVESDW